MKVIITGATGFVGSNLNIYLRNRDYQTTALSLRDDNWKNYLNGDAIIHLAGKAHDTSNTSAAEEYFSVNTELTIHLFKEFLDSNISDFFYFSSVKAVTDTVSGKLVEDHPYSPKTVYGRSKMEAEKYLLSQKLPIGKRLFIIRPCMIHGEGNKGNLNLLYNVVKTGFPWPLTVFDNQRSFLSIDNLNYLIDRMLLRRDLKSDVFNFADDDELSTNDLIVLISESLGRKPRFLKLPKWFLERVAKLGDIISLPLNSERLTKLTETYQVSNSKVKAALKLEKLPKSAKDGIRDTVKSFNSSKSVDVK